MEQVGKRIERLRNDRNMSKAQFGRLIGVSGQFIGQVEQGINNLSVELITKICVTTGVSADYILFGSIDPSEDAATTAALLGLSNEQIQIALDIIKKVAEFVKIDDCNEMLFREVVSQQLFKNDV